MANPGALRVPGAGDLPRIPGLEIERELGRGGMGVVYLARERNPDRAVALKFLPSGPFAAPRDRERWLKEARAAARVRHPRIVQLHHVDEADGWLYLVLEYVPGGSLKERLTGPQSPRVAAGLLVPIAQTLEELHGAGVWHLDLKPANILIEAEPATPLDRASLKLTDFGIARSRDEADLSGSSRGAVAGTPLYMAPEQVAGLRSALGPGTDIHAIGILLYELLTGRPPFLADSDAEILHRVRTEDPLPPRRVNPRIPRDLETVCLKCLAKEPRRRYPSAGALAEDLERWLEGHPISARPVSPLERGWRWCLRRPVVSSPAASLALALSAGCLSTLLLWAMRTGSG
jgi:eukaryotic-like serine/threonine-protein kinase